MGRDRRVIRQRQAIGPGKSNRFLGGMTSGSTVPCTRPSRSPLMQRHPRLPTPTSAPPPPSTAQPAMPSDSSQDSSLDRELKRSTIEIRNLHTSSHFLRWGRMGPQIAISHSLPG